MSKKFPSFTNDVGPWHSRSIVCKKFSTDNFKPPPHFKFTLRRYQEIAVNWMRMREVDPPGSSPMRGGILADDMGLGKTIELLALLAIDKANHQSLSMKYTYQDTHHRPLPDEQETFDNLEKKLITPRLQQSQFGFFSKQ